MILADTPAAAPPLRLLGWLQERASTLTMLVLLLTTLMVYANAFDNEFVNWDDNHYFLENPLIRELSPAGLVRIFTQFHFSDYLPVLQLSLALDYQLWGLNPLGYHLTTTLLHALNGILLFLLLHRLTQNYWLGLLTALIFLLHPVQTESVTWLAERKNVLSMAFFLLAALTHIRSREREASGYTLWLAWLFYSLAVLSKPAVVGAPLVFVALDRWWGRLSWQRILRRNAPFFLLATLSVGLTLASQGAAGGVKTYRGHSFVLTMRLMLIILWDYLAALIAPLNLNNLYQYDLNLALEDPRLWLGGGLLVLSLVIALWQPLGRPFSAFGVLWFWIFLLPVFNLVPIAIQRADRYMYFPVIGLFLLFSLALHRVWRWAGRQPMGGVLQLFLVVSLMGGLLFLGRLTMMRNQVWQNSVTLWTDHLQDYPRSETGHFNLAGHYLTQGDYAKARPLYERLIALHPDHMKAHYNLARIALAEGRLDDAIAYYQAAIRLAPEEKVLRNNLGLAYYHAEKFQEAEAAYRAAIALEPNYVKAYLNLGRLALRTENAPLAQETYGRALALAPANAEAHGGYCLALLLAEQPALAGESCQRNDLP